MVSKRKNVSPLPLTLRKRHGEGAENARKYKKIDVTGKAPVKTKAVLTETPFYDRIYIPNEEEDTNTQNTICNDYINPSKKRKKLLKQGNSERCVIDACQRILRKQFSVRSGLQDTILGQKLKFKVQNRKFVQILYNSNFHWVTVSNINC